MEGEDPHGDSGQYPYSVLETSAQFIPIISGDTKSNDVIFKQITTDKTLNNLEVKLRRVQDLTISYHLLQ